MAHELSQLLMEELGAVAQKLRELAPDLVDLLLDQYQRLIFLLLRQKGLEATQKKPTQSGKTDQEENNQKDGIQRFHDLKVRSYRSRSAYSKISLSLRIWVARIGRSSGGEAK